ncbi:hypothetical protein HU200_045660 [Digitaria exilis]|uniref:Peroxidase n=1 Tax=Digitaria exilis TaxID=1010633 RepID=A0A835BAQ1_9POAL|nr:hypothetical protein HU200_045660 [Digitaria exilis]
MASASCLSLLVLVALASAVSAQLSPTFYDTSCPKAMATIKSAVNSAVTQEARMGASLLRLHFHDCFVQASGCDASLLLAGNEQNDGPNLSLRGFNVIASIKAQVEAVCPQTVSCPTSSPSSPATPSSRRDSATAASSATVSSNLLPPSSSLAQLIKGYGNVGLSPTDMAHCASYQGHIYNDTDINQAFARSLQASCPATSGGGANVLAPLDTSTPTSFDNAYFNNLLSQKGLLHSDQELFNGGSTDNTVRNFASSPSAFSSAFATAMVKMGNISPLTGTQGQIRTTCSAAN